MDDSVLLQRLDAILAEMRAVFAQSPADPAATLAGELMRARRIVLFGVGRNGLVLQAFAMRLAHLALDAHFHGQLAMPPVGAGDLVLVALALGSLPTGNAVVGSAKAAGARVVVVTARPDAVPPCDSTIVLPAQTMADPMTSVLPLGSPFELALTLFCELTVVELMQRLSRSNADLASRHANLL